MNRPFAFFAFFAFLAITVPSLVAAEPAAKPAIAAMVGDDPIQVAEVQQMTDLIFKGKKRPTGDLWAMAQAKVLEEIVNRRLVVAYARRVGDAPSDQELAQAKKNLTIRLAAQGRRVSDVLGDESITAAELDRRVLWRLVWDRYLAKYRTPQRRQKWFDAHHRDVDGTKLVVSHILLRPPAGADARQIAALEKRAVAIREEIVSGKLDFAAAAEKYSDGPSAKQGGKIGAIGRHAPMDESFSAASFALDAGEISPPVLSPFGVHLIRCDKVTAGTKTLAELTGPIDEALAQELLKKISSLERRQTPVEYTSAWPHFKAGTNEVER